jgi:hypothetical protein
MVNRIAACDFELCAAGGTSGEGVAMMTRRETVAGILAGAAAAAAIPTLAAQTKTTALPAPRREGGRPLLSALNLRHSTRAYSSRALSMQTLSDLLWAAWRR